LCARTKNFRRENSRKIVHAWKHAHAKDGKGVLGGEGGIEKNREEGLVERGRSLKEPL